MNPRVAIVIGQSGAILYLMSNIIDGFIFGLFNAPSHLLVETFQERNIGVALR